MFFGITGMKYEKTPRTVASSNPAAVERGSRWVGDRPARSGSTDMAKVKIVHNKVLGELVSS